MTTTYSLKKVYESINNTKISYGHLIKTEFHIHTPASHDYELIPNKKYSDLSEKEVLQISVDKGLYSEEFLKGIEEQEVPYNKDDIVNHLNKKFDTTFTNFKEVIAYQLIAHKLYVSNIRAAVISDHNTVNGYKKLQAAIVDYYKSWLKHDPHSKCIVLFLGVEISCSDHYHLVAIFDDHDYSKIQDFIKKYIHSETEGTYVSCLDMVKKVSELGGIPYIAHINTSNFRGTNLYKKLLFGSNELSILGLTNVDKKDKIIDKVNGITSKLADNFCFIQEGDSHNIDQIGIKNTWIKFNKVNFKSLKKSFQNYQYCIYTEKPSLNDRFLKGMYVEPGNDGFLTSNEKENNPFIIDFSRDLNCLIGGRGVGKSTLLNILETAFTLEYDTKNYLKFISKHNMIYIVFFYKNNDFILEFSPQVGKESGYIKEDVFLEKAFINSVQTSEGRRTLAPHWVSLYKVIEGAKEREYTLVPEDEKAIILNEVYKKSYSINNIIEQINSGNISDFIKEIVLNGNKFNESREIISNLNSLHKNNYRKYLRENLNDIMEKLERRKQIVEEAIGAFNTENENLLQIIHSPQVKDSISFLEILDIHYNDQVENIKNKHVANTYLSWDDVESFVNASIQEFGYLYFLKLLLNKNHKTIESRLSINDFITDTSSGELDYINQKNINKVYNAIESRLFRDKDKMTQSIQYLLKVSDEFSLLFNVNSKESVLTETVNMKDIETLSLGQKVVAILTFLFGYGEHSNDSTPLVIDQPEDNLDNLYIYRNLVKSLRKIKNKRQVIISTHSATIVTNADAEQVIILDSDNNKGWLTKKGYPDNKTVLNHIVAILEGGQDSFIHKKETYKTVLDL
ncbi:ABC-type lipoprotein export system ATPase subunit [Alkalibacillus flavidus]|uniref:ABC-type lipoprotein export system ATPase subunit n=1 Tax=Alkalibacillus flavidus TaxID=546021 RepID=A0ABV2KW91_9BACI